MNKFATIQSGTEEHVAVFHEGHWYDATRAIPTAPATMLDLLRAGNMAPAFCSAVAACASSDHRLKEPLDFLIPIRPGKIVAIGRNYRAHAAEFDNAVPTEVIFFGKSVTACIPTGADIEIKDWYGRVDHEGELAFIIGKRAKDIAAENARDHVAGFTIINDITARTMQKTDASVGSPWFRAKNLDTFCPMGPHIVLADALGWPVAVDIEVRVNGEARQQGNTRDFIFSIEEQIAAVSKHMTLEVGDIITTGTPEGVSSLKDGDVVEVTIPEIGTLSNPVRSV